MTPNTYSRKTTSVRFTDETQRAIGRLVRRKLVPSRHAAAEISPRIVDRLPAKMVREILAELENERKD